MNIGLIDVDGHNGYPNYALMKISAFHKAQGDNVEWTDPMFGTYNKVYASKIFAFTPDFTDVYDCPIERGGTGYDLHKELPDYIDRLQPDYSIYPQIGKRVAYGFLTRGCCNKCPFCIVPIKEGAIRPYMDVEEIMIDGRTDLIAMDNNILACDYGIEQIEKIIKNNYRVDFNQAMSARLVTDDIAKMLAKVRWFGGQIRFAADTTKSISEVEKAMVLIDKYREELGKKPASYLIYTIIDGDLQSCYERLSYFKKFKRVRLQAQPYRDFNNPKQVIPQWQKDMARWADRKELFTMADFKDYEARKGFKCRQYFDNPQ